MRLKWWTDNAALKSREIDAGLEQTQTGSASDVRLLDPELDLRQTCMIEGALPGLPKTITEHYKRGRNLTATHSYYRFTTIRHFRSA